MGDLTMQSALPEGKVVKAGVFMSGLDLDIHNYRPRLKYLLTMYADFETVVQALAFSFSCIGSSEFCDLDSYYFCLSILNLFFFKSCFFLANGWLVLYIKD